MKNTLPAIITVLALNAGTAFGFHGTAEVTGVQLVHDHRHVAICYVSDQPGCSADSVYCRDKQVTFSLDKGSGKEMYSAAVSALAMKSKIFMNVLNDCTLDTMVLRR